MRLNQKGFTIRALVGSLAAMSLLALAAILPYYGLHPYRVLRHAEETMRVFDFKLREFKGQHGQFPQMLDSNPLQSPCQSCFSELGLQNFDQTGWSKLSETDYQYQPAAFLSAYSRFTVSLRYEPGEGSVRRLSVE